MNSLILKVATKLLLLLMLLFSLLLLYRGHNQPGGGFIAGLIAASAFALYLMAHGTEALRRLIRLDVRIWTAIGLFCCLLSAVLGLFFGKPLLTGLWLNLGDLKLGTPTLFDVGVYLTVISAVLMIIFSLERKPMD